MQIEHFVTLFDDTFLPLGMALHESLCAHARPFHLWVICMDEAVETHLRHLALPDLTPIPLRDIETPDLLAVKPGRSRAEYCWTLTSFTFSAVFERCEAAQRVTYLDADLFFFDDPRVLLRELDESGRHVLITEHAYAPEYDQTRLNGRFCVQFVVFDQSFHAANVMHWWQARCLESCSARPHNGKFGDQKYLDDWPTRFSDAVEVVRQTEKTLAPWNVSHVADRHAGPLTPVTYHFHNFRLVGPDRARIYLGYRICGQAMELYADYLAAVSRAIRRLQAVHIDMAPMTLPWEIFGPLRRWFRGLRGVERFTSLSETNPLETDHVLAATSSYIGDPSQGTR
jgi:hypothetical protein